MRAELAELRRFVIHYQMHKDVTSLMAAASFVIGIVAFASRAIA